MAISDILFKGEDGWADKCHHFTNQYYTRLYPDLTIHNSTFETPEPALLDMEIGTIFYIKRTTTIIVAICVASSLERPHEDYTREFIDHVFRIPNPDKVLNSVLGRLEKNRKTALARELSQEEDGEGVPEYTESLQMSRERGIRHLQLLERPPKFYPICHLERKIRHLNTNEYEYRPAHYEEIRCASMTPRSEAIGLNNEICSSLGFSCVQWNKTIHLTRRRYDSDCWETQTMVVPASCECMWPFHRLGDISLHV